jgi:hypothetical protein
MTLLQFLLTFGLMILTGSPFIVGWYIITRGEWYIQPDGRWKKYGLIFKDWSLYWEQYRKTNKIVYTGDELDKKMEFLAKVRPDLYTVTPAWSGPAKTWTKEDLPALKDALACEAELTSTGHFIFYLKDPVYYFPAWIRKPISECPICMSSIYGSTFYWFIVVQVPNLFSWSSKENLAKLGFWVIFCLILACGNKYLEQKMKL